MDYVICKMSSCSLSPSLIVLLEVGYLFIDNLNLILGQGGNERDSEGNKSTGRLGQNLVGPGVVSPMLPHQWPLEGSSDHTQVSH